MLLTITIMPDLIYNLDMDAQGKPLVWLYGEVKTPPFLKGRALDHAKQQQLEAKGWKVGSVEELLELTPEEASYSEMKLALSASLPTYR
jgi:hypothetical protein